MNTFSRILTKNRILWLTHIGSLLPFALLLWDYYADNLSVNPIQEITFRTGKPALGLYAWGYVSVHFLVFIGLDYGFDWGLLYEAIFEKRYALVGFAALLILTPLALTSTKGWQKRLGKKWKRLHQLVYAAGLLGVFHYLWLVKSDVREPIAWGVVVVLLLVARIPRVRKALVGWRTQLTGKNAPPSTSRSQRRVDPRQITSG
jgi:methionine sulfoxide reductase heme-binding subunit